MLYWRNTYVNDIWCGSHDTHGDRATQHFRLMCFKLKRTISYSASI